MSNPLSRIATRVAYGASQLPRVAWYIGHSLAMRRLAEAARRRDSGTARQRAHTSAPVPDRRRLYADMAMLLWQDLANVEAGLYPVRSKYWSEACPYSKLRKPKKSWSFSGIQSFE
jgi:hypothetical protein